MAAVVARLKSIVVPRKFLTASSRTASLWPRLFDPQLAGALQIELKRMISGVLVGRSPASCSSFGACAYNVRCPMPGVDVLKFGSSVLRTPDDLHVAVDEIYRRWRDGCQVLAVVSAFEGVTNQLLGEVTDLLRTDCPEAAAAYLSTGEQQTAALLHGALRQHGLPSRIIDPREIGLLAEGLRLDATPGLVAVDELDRLWSAHSILVLPGFYGIDKEGVIALFGRGGSDLSALFLAAALRAKCKLLKDVAGVHDADPASDTHTRRFSALSWSKAIEVSGPLIQPKALHYAQSHALPFEVGRPNENDCTLVGEARDEWAAPTPPSQPLRVVLLGCGIVGGGVYETIKRYPDRFELLQVIVRDPGKYPDVDCISTDHSRVLDSDVDAVIVCFGGVTLAYPLMAAALNAGKYVITANKAAVAAQGEYFAQFSRGNQRQFWCSATVGGALPALETLAGLKSPITEIRGIINGTCGFVLEAWASGRSRHDAVAMAQAAGFAEANPARDLSGRDSADKLALMIEAGFGQWVAPDDISTRGIDSIPSDDPTGYKLIARAKRTALGIVASVSPEEPPPSSFLGQARGAENRLEIELEMGEIIRLRAQGAGRWPTTVSVMGDLHSVARQRDVARR